MSDADFVIEAVNENLALKQAIFERVGALNANAILMSNSSVLPIGEIAARTPLPERAVGTHWWNPPQLIPIVEVIKGPKTSEQVMLRAMEFHAALGKMPVRVDRDVPGFIGNRIQHALWREALSLVAEGECDASYIPQLARSGVALYVQGGWRDDLRAQGLVTFANVKTPKHIVIGPWDHCGNGDFDLLAEMHRFFDQYLKVVDTGITRQAPIHYYVVNESGEKAWRSADSWPVPNAQPVDAYLSSSQGARLTTVAPKRVGKGISFTSRRR